jgi:hypothetical protein
MPGSLSVKISIARELPQRPGIVEESLNHHGAVVPVIAVVPIICVPD